MKWIEWIFSGDSHPLIRAPIKLFFVFSLALTTLTVIGQSVLVYVNCYGNESLKNKLYSGLGDKVVLGIEAFLF